MKTNMYIQPDFRLIRYMLICVSILAIVSCIIAFMYTPIYVGFILISLYSIIILCDVLLFFYMRWYDKKQMEQLGIESTNLERLQNALARQQQDMKEGV